MSARDTIAAARSSLQLTWVDVASPNGGLNCPVFTCAWCQRAIVDATVDDKSTANVEWQYDDEYDHVVAWRVVHKRCSGNARARSLDDGSWHWNDLDEFVVQLAMNSGVDLATARKRIDVRARLGF